MQNFSDFIKENSSNKRKYNNIEEVHWEDLYAYSFEAYPFKIVVLTNADESQIVDLWREFEGRLETEMETSKTPVENMNFHDFLKTKGFMAISGNKTNIRPLDRIA